MSHKFRLLLIATICLFNLTQGWAKRRTETINDAWKFSTQTTVSDWMKPDFDDSHWKTVSIPHTWNAIDSNNETPGYYRGDGWYRKNITIDTSMQDKQVDIYFEGANQVTEVWVNGHYAGIHKGGYTRFNFDITPFIRFGQKNSFCIRVNNAHNPEIAPLSADFTFFGGIYRDVYLRYKTPVHLATDLFASSGIFITTPDVNEEKAVVNFNTHISNKTQEKQQIRLEHLICDTEGNVVASFSAKHRLKAAADANRTNDRIILNRPRLWSPESPYLYQVFTRIYDRNNNLLDEVYNPLGIRWFEFDADKGFFLNGKKTKLIGTNRHQDFHEIGNALSDEKHLRDMRMIKEMGSNFLRVSHYPQDPVVLETCDRIGLLTSVEIPIVNAITESDEFSNNCLHMAREMVLQDFNHPSVIIWSYMNEVMLRPPFKNDSVRHATYCQSVGKLGAQIEAVIRKTDPHRYTIIPFHGNYKAYEEAGLTPLPMIHGWNLYQGWYSGKFSGFGEFLDGVKKLNPDKPQMITEYGADVDPRLHAFQPERFDFTAEYANLYHYAYLDAILDRDFVAGATIWNLNDFYSESRADAVPHVNNKGIVSTDRKLKDTYLYYQSVFNPEPAIRIGARNWHIRGGVAKANEQVCVQPVTIFANIPEVEVFHNGVSLGKKKVSNHRIELEIPFTAGKNTLLAEALHEGKKLTDQLVVDFRLVPGQFAKGNPEFHEMNILLGTTRYLEDSDNNQVWIPEQPYTSGSWGYIGGTPYRKKTRYGSQPSSEIDILGSTLDPVFQTQRVGIEAFRADVPDGKYAVTLYWTELDSDKQREALAYNLGNDAIGSKISKREFDVKINDLMCAEKLNLEAEYGADQAVIKKFFVIVKDGEGINIQFNGVVEEPVLNAVRIQKIY